MNFLKKSSSAGSHAGGEPSAQIKELLSGVADKLSVAIMMVDRDFIVTYVNAPTMELLRKNADGFRKLWPSFDPDRIVGTCIDTFHKNPVHQRKMLADASKMPINTEITIGDLKIQLLVSANFDRKGNHVGNVLEWRDVTSARLNEGMLAAIDRAQAVIEFSLDGIIQHANENFLKTLGYTLDEIKGNIIRCLSIRLIGRARNTARSGKSSAAASSMPGNTGVMARVARKSGSRRATIQSSTRTARRSRSSSSPPTSPSRKQATANFEGQIAAIGKAQAVIEFGLMAKF